MKACPICGGRGWVRGDFYLSEMEKRMTSAAPDKTMCKSCGGTGLVSEG